MAGIRFFGAIVLALASGSVQAAAQDGGQSSAQTGATQAPAAAQGAGAYAIYSLLLADAPPTPRYPLAIAADSLSADQISSQPEPDLTPDAHDQHAFQDALSDYHARGGERAQIQHMLGINRPYTLLTGDETARFRANPGTVAGLPASTHVVLFSEVYFNPGQTAALVYMTHLCAAPCGSGEWIYLIQQGGTWIRASRATPNAADEYAIYSLLMPGVPFTGMSATQAPHFAIAAETVDIDQMNPAIPPDAQLQPPPDNVCAFQEALEDYYSRRHERIVLQPKLQLDRPYRLLTAEEIEQLRTALTGIDPGSQLKDAWAGYPGITFFSEIYFNAASTAALVYMNNWCASLCANGQWHYLEKRDGQWVRRSGLNI